MNHKQVSVCKTLESPEPTRNSGHKIRCYGHRKEENRYTQFCLLWYNAPRFVESQPTFQKSKHCLLVSCLAYSSTLKMEATCSSETSVGFQRITRRYVSADRTLETRRNGNLRFYKTGNVRILWKLEHRSVLLSILSIRFQFKIALLREICKINFLLHFTKFDNISYTPAAVLLFETQDDTNEKSCMVAVEVWSSHCFILDSCNSQHKYASLWLVVLQGTLPDGINFVSLCTHDVNLETNSLNRT
jgi:hypothetical protein